MNIKKILNPETQPTFLLYTLNEEAITLFMKI